MQHTLNMDIATRVDPLGCHNLIMLSDMTNARSTTVCQVKVRPGVSNRHSNAATDTQCATLQPSSRADIVTGM